MVELAPLERQAYPGLNLTEAAKPSDIVRIVNNLLVGRQNVVLEVEVEEAMTFPVTVLDERFTPQSWVGVMDMGYGGARFYVNAVREGECDVSWMGTAGWNTATLKLLVIG